MYSAFGYGSTFTRPLRSNKFLLGTIMSPQATTTLLLLLFAVAAQSSPERRNYNERPKDKPEKVEIKATPSATSRGAIGQGFEIRKMDLLTKQFKATGAKIFEDLPLDECTKSDKLGQIQRDDSFYSSTKSLYQSVSSNTKVDGSLKGAYTLSASVEAVTNNVASGETNVSGLSLNLVAYSLSSGLKKDCINKKPLAKELVKDFEALPKEIKNPWKKSSWRQYKVFLEKYGSHFVKESISGSSIYQYVFAKSDKKFTQKDFTVKACLSLAGPTQAGEVGVSACSEVSKKDVSKSSSQEMTKKLVVRGGKSETRSELSGQLTAEQINKFMKEAETDPSPIKYHFEPIWKVLKARYVGKEHFAKAVNLEQFYKGYLSYGCKYQKTRNGKVMQKFDLDDESDPESPTYACKLYAEGCHDKYDCHYRAAFWCACYGDSCIRHKDKELASGQNKKSAEIVLEKNDIGWQHSSCELSGLSCWCTAEKKNQWISAWRGEELDDGVNDIHAILMDRNRRDQAKRDKLHHE